LNPLERVPYFSFLDRETGIDAELSKEKGYDVPRLQTFIMIVPHGSKDPVEFIADEFIERKSKEPAERYNHEWVREFKKGLELYREGKEIPRHGTPLITWERIAKDQRESLARMFPTIEDLAAVPDSAVSNIGLNGRVLRDLAKAEIQAKKDLSPVVKELAEEKENVRRLQEQLDNLSDKFNELEKEQKTIHLKKSA
jgi:hypothetical protein